MASNRSGVPGARRVGGVQRGRGRGRGIPSGRQRTGIQSGGRERGLPRGGQGYGARLEDLAFVASSVGTGSAGFPFLSEYLGPYAGPAYEEEIARRTARLARFRADVAARSIPGVPNTGSGLALELPNTTMGLGITDAYGYQGYGGMVTQPVYDIIPVAVPVNYGFGIEIMPVPGYLSVHGYPVAGAGYVDQAAPLRYVDRTTPPRYVDPVASLRHEDQAALQRYRDQAASRSRGEQTSAQRTAETSPIADGNAVRPRPACTTERPRPVSTEVRPIPGFPTLDEISRWPCFSRGPGFLGTAADSGSYGAVAGPSLVQSPAEIGSYGAVAGPRCDGAVAGPSFVQSSAETGSYGAVAGPSFVQSSAETGSNGAVAGPSLVQSPAETENVDEEEYMDVIIVDEDDRESVDDENNQDGPAQRYFLLVFDGSTLRIPQATTQRDSSTIPALNRPAVVETITLSDDEED